MKKEKEEANKEIRLLSKAFELFTEKGVKNTSIQEIVDNANVAKGTFYLYFKDKYEIRDVLIAKKSHKLFNDALQELRKKEIKTLSERVIFIVNYVVDELTKAPTLLKFISKNLSWGVYNKTVLKIYERTENEEEGLYQLFLKEVKENEINLKSPEVTLFMIIELVSSTCFNSILYNEPLPIDEYKPYLYDTIRKLING
jgi:AcrR family transcriptional regulator